MEQEKTISKKRQIRDYVVSRIASGEWGAGEKIPTRARFEELFGTTPVTVNSALHPLVQEGFLRVAGKGGTRVHPNPPPLAHYALIFPEQFDAEGYASRFRDIILAAARAMEGRAGVQFVEYHQFSAHVDNEAYVKLADDACNQRLAGIFFVNWAYGMERTPLFATLQLPMLALVSHVVDARVQTVYFDRQTQYREMVAELVRRNVRRPALITTTRPGRGIEFLERAFSEAGLALAPEFHQFIHLEAPWSAEYVARLLFRLPRNERPDGLLISDDNLTTPALLGVSAALGEGEAAKLPIVSHVNLPLPDRSLLPGRGFGFDLEELLGTVVRVLSTPREDTNVNAYWLRPVSCEL